MVQTHYLIAAGLLLLYLAVVGLLAVSAYRKAGSMKRVLAIHLLCGAEKKQLIAALVCVTLLQVLAVSLISLGLCWFLMRWIVLPGGFLWPVLPAAVLAPLPASFRIAHMKRLDGMGGS